MSKDDNRTETDSAVRITLPLTDKITESLHAGDYVYLTGTVYVARDAAHKRMKEALDAGEKLPFEDKKMVGYILNITQLIRKYELDIDTVKFENSQVFLYYKKIVIALGSPANVDEKIAELPNMLKEAKGLKGTLHMENFTVGSGIATFDPK